MMRLAGHGPVPVAEVQQAGFTPIETTLLDPVPDR